MSENVKSAIFRGVMRRRPGLDFVRVEDVGLVKTDDRIILEWAAEHGRIVVTHDVSTMKDYAYDRVRVGLPMPGVIEIPERLAIG